MFHQLDGMEGGSGGVYGGWGVGGWNGYLAAVENSISSSALERRHRTSETVR